MIDAIESTYTPRMNDDAEFNIVPPTISMTSCSIPLPIIEETLDPDEMHTNTYSPRINAAQLPHPPAGSHHHQDVSANNTDDDISMDSDDEDSLPPLYLRTPSPSTDSDD